jgi:hypothetical protein
LLIAPEIAAGVGIDMPVYVFRREDKQWRLVLSDNGASVYDVVSSDHELALSRPNAGGHWFVVITHLTGALHGSHASLRYRVLRAGDDPHSPQTLLAGESAARRLFGPYYIRTQTDGFELEFVSDAVDRDVEFDTDAMTGTRLLRFRLEGDQMKLVARKQLKPAKFDIPASADE